MTRKIGDLAIPAGSYTDRSGNEKTRWENIGGLFETDNGRRFLTIKRTFAPSGIPIDPNGNNRENVIINLFDTESSKKWN